MFVLRANAGKAPFRGCDIAIISWNVQPIIGAKRKDENVKNENSGNKVPPTNGEDSVV